MTRAALPAVALALLAAAPPAAAQHGETHSGRTRGVTLLAMSLTPVQVAILAGDTVTWSNDSFLGHTVTSDAQDWSSGILNNADEFSHHFETAGAYGYFCRFHPNIRGRVDAFQTMLEPSAGPVPPGRPFTLAGRTVLAAETPITIEADTGAGFAPVAATVAQAGGTFAARVPAGATGRYRAVAAGETGPALSLVALEHRVDVTAGGARVRARVTPAAPGLRLVLQLRLPERFGWWPIATARLGASPTATLTTRGPRRVRARVVLTQADGATILATSRTFRARAPR